MTQEKREQFDRIAPLIGRTPLLEIHYRFRGEARRLFANMRASEMELKAEYIAEQYVKYWAGLINLERLQAQVRDYEKLFER